MSGSHQPRYLALSGGVGGAKLALGLAHALDPPDLLVIANTGDDFDHLGLLICPDIDTLTYTLAGLDNPETGWGRADESWNFLATLDALGGETWFRLGDRDLALHVERTRRIRAGETLSTVTKDFSRRFGVDVAVAPMSDQPVRTVVDTRDGPLPFQHYFVRLRCAPAVTGIAFEGVQAARPSPALSAALSDDALAAVIICPSNPFISIDPILAVPGVGAALRRSPATVIAVSPIVAGRALKGPTAKMMTELGLTSDAAAVARHYGDLIDGFVLDRQDAAAADAIRALGPEVLIADTVMHRLDDKVRLGREVLSFATRLRG